MWRRWSLFCATCLQEKSLQRLAVAIVISLLLHLFLLGKFYLSLPSLDNTNTHPLTAELISSKPVKLATPAIKKLPKAPIKETEPIEPAVEKPTELAPANEVLPESALEQMVGSDALSEPPPAEKILTPQLENPLQDNQIDLGVTINTDAYRYVETEFDVRTDIEASVQSSPAGRAKIVYQLLPSAEYYQIDSLMAPSGLAALFISDLVEKSIGLLTDSGLRPSSFLYQYGNKVDKTYKATFDWDNAILKMQTAKGEKQVPLEKGAQDLLSFMYQFMFIPPLNNMALNITNGKKLSHYEYSFEGEAIIFSKMGDIKTIQIARSNADNDDKIELWLALDYQYVPVKIRKSEKNGKVYELLVTSLKTTKPDQQTNPQ